jgi:hypothetical protein
MILCLALFIYSCVDCSLHIEFLNDGDMLHDSTLLYTILDVQLRNILLFLMDIYIYDRRGL